MIIHPSSHLPIHPSSHPISQQQLGIKRIRGIRSNFPTRVRTTTKTPGQHAHDRRPGKKKEQKSEKEKRANAHRLMLGEMMQMSKCRPCMLSSANKNAWLMPRGRFPSSIPPSLPPMSTFRVKCLCPSNACAPHEPKKEKRMPRPGHTRSLCAGRRVVS